MGSVDKVVVSVEFHSWLAGFAKSVSMPLDKVLIMLAMTGVRHFDQCEKLPQDPKLYRKALESAK